MATTIASVKRGPLPLTACAHCRKERGPKYSFHCTHCGWWRCPSCGWLNSRIAAIRGGSS